MITEIGQNIKFTGVDSNIGTTNQIKKNEKLSGTVSSVQTDSFEKQGNTKKLSTSTKIGIGAGILTVGGLIATAIFTKGKNIKPANFAEHLDFKPAQTMEEAIAYAKKNLGVEKFDFGNDVEMANWVNEGLTNINNRFKGKANMPKELRWADKANIEKIQADCSSKVAQVGAYCQGDTLAFNQQYFSADKIKEVQSVLKLIFPPVEGKPDSLKKIMVHGEDTALKEKLLKQYIKLLKSPNNYTRFDAINTSMMLDDYVASIKLAEKNPTYFIERALKHDKAKEILEKQGIDLSVENFNKLSPEKQKEYMEKLFHTAYSNNIAFASHATHRGNSKFDILYHEMGHLLHHKNVSHADEFWGKLSEKSEKAFLADNGKLETAGKISWYAQTNQYEFVAETFNALCAGKKLPKDVMDLYKYYKGPELPNM